MTLYDQERLFRVKTIRKALARAHGNRTRTAERLGIRRTYLLRLMRVHGLQRPA